MLLLNRVIASLSRWPGSKLRISHSTSKYSFVKTVMPNHHPVGFSRHFDPRPTMHAMRGCAKQQFTVLPGMTLHIHKQKPNQQYTMQLEI